MNITFLIGNGFDLGLGLKTRFTDYYHIYLNKRKGKPHLDLDNKAFKNGINQWSDFEIDLGKYAANFSIVNKDKFVSELSDFEDSFNDYLKQEESTILYDKKTYIVDQMTKALLHFDKSQNIFAMPAKEIQNIYEQHPDEEHIYNFINFNYTHTFENCLHQFPTKEIAIVNIDSCNVKYRYDKIIHLHREIDNIPIMGVNDINQIDNEYLADDTEFVGKLVKPMINKYYQDGNDIDSEDIINNSTVICIYGMSIGKTDENWWRLISIWLVEKETRHLIVYEYREGFRASNQFDTRYIIEEIKDKFEKFVCIPKNSIKRFRSRIHVVISKNIFEMDLTKKDNQDEQEEVEAAATQVTKEED